MTKRQIKETLEKAQRKLIRLNITFNTGHEPLNFSDIETHFSILLYVTEFSITEMPLGRTFHEVLLPKFEIIKRISMGPCFNYLLLCNELPYT